MTTPQPAALPEQVWLMYAKKKPGLRRLSFVNDLSSQEKASGWVSEPYALAALQSQPAARNIAAELSLMVLCAVKDLPGLHANMLKDVDSAIEANRAAAQPAAAGVSDDEREAFEAWATSCWHDTSKYEGLYKSVQTHALWCAWETRAILALRPQSESKTYADGTTATGPAPLPDVSPAEQDASLAERLLTDLEVMLGQRNGASIKLRSLIRSLRPQAVPMTRDERLAAWKAATIDLPSPENCYLRGLVDAEAHHGITAQGAQGGEVE